MTARDETRLTGVQPDLVRALRTVFLEMEHWGTPMFVVEGVRTVERQATLYAQGRTQPGPIVTYKNGTTHTSKHQPRADGFGYAVDCAFTTGNPFAESHPWEMFGTKLEEHGVLWGGRWTMRDLPHAEWPYAPRTLA